MQAGIGALAALFGAALLSAAVAGSTAAAGEQTCFYYHEFAVDSANVPPNGFINFGIGLHLQPGSHLVSAQLVDIVDDQSPPATYFGAGITWQVQHTVSAGAGGTLDVGYFAHTTPTPGSVPSKRHGTWAFTVRYLTSGQTCDATSAGEAAHVLAFLAPFNRSTSSTVADLRAGRPYATDTPDQLRGQFATVLARFPVIWRGVPTGTLLHELARVDVELSALADELPSLANEDGHLRAAAAGIAESLQALAAGRPPVAVAPQLNALAAAVRALRQSSGTTEAALDRIAAQKKVVVRSFPRLFGSPFDAFMLDVEAWYQVAPSGFLVYDRPHLLSALRDARPVLRRLEARIRRVS